MSKAVALLTALLLAGGARSGTWSQYGKTPTDNMVAYRQAVGQLDDPDTYGGFVAVVSCDLVGRDGWAYVAGQDSWLHVYVYDCSGHTTTTQGFARNGIIGELDYYTARRLGIPLGRGVHGALLLPGTVR